MERLMTLKLEVRHCSASVRLNDFPLLRCSPGQELAFLSIHEFTFNGLNRLELIIEAPDKNAGGSSRVQLAEDALATAQVLLPRLAQDVSELSARSLGELVWQGARGEELNLPLTRRIEIELPVSFPVWRWAKAPPTEASEEMRRLAFDTLADVAAALDRGDPEPFLQLVQLRTEEISLAYQRDPADDARRLRTQLMVWQEAGALKWVAADPDKFQLRSIASGRLLECLDDSGQPALRTKPDADGIARSFPLRFASVAGKIYVLR